MEPNLELQKCLRLGLFLIESETPNATVFQMADALAERIQREFEVVKRG